MQKRFPLLLLLLAALATTLSAKKPNLKKLDKKIAEAYETFAPAGMAVAIVQDGEIVYKKAFGEARSDQSQALQTDHLFSIASCTKAFTAAALAKLVKEEKVRWDDKVIDYFPDFKLADPYITQHLSVKDLLCHRTGLGTFYGDLLWYGTDYTNEEIMARMQHLPITNEFHSEFGYQNNMFMIAGEIIEKVSGKEWEDYIQENFFDPLGMANSRTSNDVLRDGDPIAYPHLKGQTEELFDFNGTKPAASIYSSVEDLSHWVAMLMNDGKYKGKQVLAPETIAAMFKSETVQGISPLWQGLGTRFKTYGLGWGLFDYRSAFVAEHNGGMPGYISKVSVMPDRNVGVIILNNGMDFFINDVVRFLVYDEFLQAEERRDWTKEYKNVLNGYNAWMEGQNAERMSARKEGTQPSLNLISYVGRYQDKMYGEAEVRVEGDNLYIELLPTKKFFYGTLTHWHDDSFKVEFDDPFLPFGLINFELADGSVKGFKIDLPNDDFHFFNLDFRSLE